MEKQYLIDTAKVKLTDNGKRSTKGSIIHTMEIETVTGYKFIWDWAFEKDCTPDRIAYLVQQTAYNAFTELHKNCSENPCPTCMDKIYSIINSQKFAYARFNPSGLGNYYTIYHIDADSPTGVRSAGGCSEKIWEKISKEVGKQNQYYSPTENKMTVR